MSGSSPELCIKTLIEKHFRFQNEFLLFLIFFLQPPYVIKCKFKAAANSEPQNVAMTKSSTFVAPPLFERFFMIYRVRVPTPKPVRMKSNRRQSYRPQVLGDDIEVYTMQTSYDRYSGQRTRLKKRIKTIYNLYFF